MRGRKCLWVTKFDVRDGKFTIVGDYCPFCGKERDA